MLCYHVGANNSTNPKRLLHDTTGNLDPISCLQGTSFLVTSPPTAGTCSIGRRTASARGGSTLRRRKTNNTGAPIPHVHVSHAGFAGDGPGADTTLWDDTLTCQHGDTPASLHIHKNVRGHATSATSKTVFVRSKQWGKRSPNWAQPQRQAANKSGSLGVHRVALAGGKRQGPATASERTKYEQACSRHSVPAKIVRVAQSSQRRRCNTRRTNRKVEGAAGNQFQSREGTCVESPGTATVANEGQHQNTGPLEGGKARLVPSAASASLVTPSMEVPSETSYPCNRNATSIEWRVEPSPAAYSKLRPDDSQRHLYRHQAPRWFTSAAAATAATPEKEGEKKRLLAADESDYLLVSTDTRATTTVATKVEHGTPGSTASVVRPAEGVPQPLSVVAVWSRPPSQMETARKSDSSREGAINPREVGWDVGAAEELSLPINSKTADFRGTKTTEAPLERDASCR